jgi:3-phenylpropionate/cinnamic acid dioxygenase small subunit
VSDAHEAIRNLLGRYCELMDAGDWSGLGDLFAGAVLLDDASGAEAARGRDGVRRLYESTKTYAGSPRTRHLTTNTIIEVAEAGDRATARSAFVVLQAVDGLPLQPIAAGRYRDTFAVTDGRWHFIERRFSLDLVGDLSHHLAWSPT